LHLTGGNVVDCTVFEAVMTKFRLRRRIGRPRTRPDRLLGDKGYSSKKIRLHLRRRGIQAVIPKRGDQIATSSPWPRSPMTDGSHHALPAPAVHVLQR